MGDVAYQELPEFQMLVPNVYILGGGIYKFNKSIYHLKEMRYVLIVQILDGTSYWANQKTFYD